MKILSDAYNDPSKAEFYEFVRSLDAAKVALANNKDNVLILDKDSPLVDIFYMMLGD
jgi:membrane protease subunit HflC